jgi:3-hydroxyacyl-CoA dehydrogenase
MDLKTLTDKICFDIKDGHYNLAKKRFEELKNLCKNSSADEIQEAMKIIEEAKKTVFEQFEEVAANLK